MAASRTLFPVLGGLGSQDHWYSIGRSTKNVLSGDTPFFAQGSQLSYEDPLSRVPYPVPPACRHLRRLWVSVQDRHRSDSRQRVKVQCRVAVRVVGGCGLRRRRHSLFDVPRRIIVRADRHRRRCGQTMKAHSPVRYAAFPFPLQISRWASRQPKVTASGCVLYRSSLF